MKSSPHTNGSNGKVESPQEWFARTSKELRQDPEYLTEYLKLCVTEDFCGYMIDHGISRTALAEKLGCSRAHVTQLLSPDRNLTLRSICTVALALGCDVEMVLKPRPAGKAGVKGKRVRKNAAVTAKALPRRRKTWASAHPGR